MLYRLLHQNEKIPLLEEKVRFLHIKKPVCRYADGSFFYIWCDYAPKLSNKMFSAGTPRLSSIFTTDDAIIGGPHIR